METNCNDHKFIFVKYFSQGGRKILRKQCFSCGESDGISYKLNSVLSFQLLPEYSKLKNENFYKKIEIERIKKIEIEKEDFWKEYNIYLNSEKWKNKRKFVLTRDNNICQACLTNKATQVHHLSYKHIYNEPLFELTSICKPCHDKITQLDNESRTN